MTNRNSYNRTHQEEHHQSMDESDQHHHHHHSWLDDTKEMLLYLVDVLLN